MLRRGDRPVAPASISPRQVPARTARQGLRNEVQSRRPQRMAAAEARERHPPAGPQAEARQRLVGIFRAGRQVAAMVADQRGEGVSVDLYQHAAATTRGAGEPLPHGSAGGGLLLIGYGHRCGRIYMGACRRRRGLLSIAASRQVGRAARKREPSSSNRPAIWLDQDTGRPSAALPAKAIGHAAARPHDRTGVCP